MRQNTIDLTLLKKAQQGHEESMSILSELARKDILAYLNRMTLDANLAEDLCQETMLQMLKSLPRLRITAVMSFWAWLYKTAYSMVSRHFRDQGRTRVRRRTFVNNDFMKQMPADGKSISDDLIRKELAVAIYDAMDSIKIKYRNVLALRCFQNLSYNEIAMTTGGSELQARLLFFRAKRSLRRQLATRGYKKKGQLLSALSLFAAITAGSSRSASAAAIVKAASLNVSVGTIAMGIATTKVGIISMITIATCITAGVASRDAFTRGMDEPRPVYGRVKSEDSSLFDLLQEFNFRPPSSIGKANAPDDNGFLWTDRSYKGPSEPGANLVELLIDRAKLDRRAVILPADSWILMHFQNPLIDGVGADIIVAGWVGPAPQIEVFSSEGKILQFAKLTQLMDTWDRNIYGYDLAELPGDFVVNAVRIIGTHSDGPHQGFELNEIRARQP